ncbi:DUF5682 family protein [Streptomyces cuspidosporus]|uniref:Uncharacterized protein n=1 Tax=Streptomyces cuspidosporus TaxID=66882 RepID=A0ABN3H378_9ACTN
MTGAAPGLAAPPPGARPDAAGAPWPLLLGVRHHGPGSARAVRAALDACGPAAVLIEGPPEGDALVGFAAEEGMRPPVALLAHAVGDPGQAAFWPLAEFSPEWVAIRWALSRGVPVRFIDLPAANSLAMAVRTEDRTEDRTSDRTPDRTDGRTDEDPGPDPAGRLRVDPLGVLAETAGYDDPERWWEDVVEHRGVGTGAPGGVGAPGGIGAVAGSDAAAGSDAVAGSDAAAGSDMAGAVAPFAALGEAMAALRAEYGHGGHEHDAVREAHMRLRLREARREFGDRVAVVCGAWHVPALAGRTTATADRGLLKGLPKVRAELSWVPWTHRRLARHSGYGAGIASPGWYSHLFHAEDRPLERWMTKVAGLLRAEDFAVSSAHVIEAVRLAETLAAVRGRPLAGLAETTDAVRAVLCEGSDVPLAIVHDRLVVGDVLGEVPESAPAAPLQRDLARTQRSLRLKPEAMERELELDLRKETDAARSRLLHRLRLLGVDWGTPAASRGSTGTFRETWRLRWEPELSVRVAEAGVWGTTVLSAATARAEAKAVDATALGEVTELAERCLLAALPDALPVVMRALADRAALDADVGHLAQALPALVRSVRYGDVRGTDTAALAEVAMGLAERVLVGLPPACFGLDADGAAEMRGHLEAVHQAVGLLAEIRPGGAARAEAGLADPEGAGRGGGPGDASGRGSAQGAVGAGGGAASGGAEHAEAGPAGHNVPVGSGGPAGANGPVGRAGPGGSAGPAGAGDASGRGDGLRGRWGAVLRSLAGADGVSGLIRGRAARLLLDDGRLAEGEAARLMGLVLSPGTAPAEAASWIEGFVGGGAGGGMLLVHDERLLGLLDRWLTGVPAEAFTDVLPLLRRTFAAYDAGVRRTLGELVRRGPAPADGPRPAGGPAAPGFGPGLDEDRAAAVVPVVRLLLGLDHSHVGHDNHHNHHNRASEVAG